MVRQRLDLGQFGHVIQCARRSRRRAAFCRRTISDSSQLTIDSTIAAQIAVHQKSSMTRPQWVVCSVIQEVIHSINALMTMWIRPSVRM